MVRIASCLAMSTRITDPPPESPTAAMLPRTASEVANTGTGEIEMMRSEALESTGVTIRLRST
jgi:hypothetical protein